MTVSRSPFDNLRGTPANLQDVDRSVFTARLLELVQSANDEKGNSRTGQALSHVSFMGSQVPPIGRPQPNQFEQGFGGDSLGSPTSQLPQHKKLADMTDAERYGLPGLLSMIPLESPDYSSLAVGQDLTVLGLDLSRPE